MVIRVFTSIALSASLIACTCSISRAQAPAVAQGLPDAPAASTGTVTGTVSDSAHRPIARVKISTLGQMSQSVTTGSDGSFSIVGLPAGLYTVNVTKAGFTPVQQDIVVTAGSTTKASVTIESASLSSLQTIGRVSAASRGSVGFNTTTASVAALSASDIIDQGQLNVNHILNQVPGLTIGNDDYNAIYGNPNAASPLATGVPSLRGSLPYETASLIDGHPINIGLSGTFNPAFINPYVLQDVEVAKGPGASATNINYAIGGTINFRTLEPTLQPHQSFDTGVDQFGGQNANVRATGTVADGKLGYAFDYAAQGTQGPTRGLNPLNPLLYTFGGPPIINGTPTCLNPAVAGHCSLGTVTPPNPTFIGNPNAYGAIDYTAPLVMSCCQRISLDSSGRNELGKLRYSFTPSTSLTVTYLGGQLRGQQAGGYDYTLPDYYFEPPAGYTGSLPAFSQIPQDNQDRGELYENVNLFSEELRSSVGSVTLNARYYAASDNDAFGVRDQPNSIFVGPLYGGVPLNNATTPTFFNGQIATVDIPIALYTLYSQDDLSGYTVQASLPFGNDFLSFSYDSVHDSSSSTQLNETLSPTVVLPAGSRQTFQTVTLKAQLQLAPNANATISDYATLYSDHYSQDFGTTFLDSTHAYSAPRLAFSLRPNQATALRAAAGFSIAPPYLSLLTNSPPIPGSLASYFTVTNNSGDVAPETAFGWDVGSDLRLGRNIGISADLYQTDLSNQFLTATHLATQPFIVAPVNSFGVQGGSYPLYVTQTQNLGHSRYEGIELSIQRTPTVGLGFKLKGALQRAYPYDIPPGFYDTAAGPNTTNLGVVPNINFQTAGLNYNALGTARVPYSQGYVELNMRRPNNSYFLVGVTYYGPNNSFNEPPFGVVTASYRQPIGKRSSLLLAVNNVTSAYPSYATNSYRGVPTPLINNKLGLTDGISIGPSTASLTLHMEL